MMKIQLPDSNLIKFRMYQKYFSSTKETKVDDSEKKVTGSQLLTIYS